MEVVSSQILAYGVIACIQAAILTIFGVYVVNVSVHHMTRMSGYYCIALIVCHL